MVFQERGGVITVKGQVNEDLLQAEVASRPRSARNLIDEGELL